MKSYSTITIFTLFAIFLLHACKNNRLEHQYEQLQELPNELLSTLDTNTLTTAVASVYVVPTQDTTKQALAPCCSLKEEKELEVTFTYTRCLPLRDLIFVNLDDLAFSSDRQKSGSSSENTALKSPQTKIYKWEKRKFKSILDQIVCVTSDGPWNATLTESRACNNFSPHQSLRIFPHGELIVFEWNGGVELHPANVGLVSCRRVGTIRSSCGGLSTCDCSSSLCPENDPCECNLSGSW